MTIDMRAHLRREQDEAEAAIYEVLRSPTVPDVTVEIEKLAHSRPMEKTASSAALVEAAVSIADALGFELRDAATGGGSDANTTAGAGVPSVDGLGPVGGNDHTPVEYIEPGSIVPRTTLLAALLLAVGD